MTTLRSILCLLAIMASSSAFAQERAATGNMEIQTNWAALKTLVDSAKIESKAAQAVSTAITTCGKKGMLYAPETEGADAQGCKAAPMADTTKLDIRSYNRTLCARGGGHSVVSACGAGESLLGCGGGPGDQLEKAEYWVLMPDFKNNRCIGYVGEPACYDSGWSQTMVIASCYRP